jgi:hypothetical protein
MTVEMFWVTLESRRKPAPGSESVTVVEKV